MPRGCESAKEEEERASEPSWREYAFHEHVRRKTKDVRGKETDEPTMEGEKAARARTGTTRCVLHGEGWVAGSSTDRPVHRGRNVTARDLHGSRSDVQRQLHNISRLIRHPTRTHDAPSSRALLLVFVLAPPSIHADFAFSFHIDLAALPPRFSSPRTSIAWMPRRWFDARTTTPRDHASQGATPRVPPKLSDELTCKGQDEVDVDVQTTTMAMAMRTSCCAPALRARAERRTKKVRGRWKDARRISCVTEAVESRAERFSKALESKPWEQAEDDAKALVRGAEEALEEARMELECVEKDMDKLYRETFQGIVVHVGEGSTEQDKTETGTDNLQRNVQDLFKKVRKQPIGSREKIVIESMSEDEFAELGRKDPDLFRGLTEAASRRDKDAWLAFQTKAHELKLKRERILKAMETAKLELGTLKQQADLVEQARELEQTTDQGDLKDEERKIVPKTGQARIVLITGFESFNVALYTEVAERLKGLTSGGVVLSVFSDRDIVAKRDQVADELNKADVLFASLLFDFDQVEWLREKIGHIPIRLIFESSLELMSQTSVGSFQMKSGQGGEKAGPPAPVKAVLSKFGSGREEDRMVGYLSFLKVGPKLLQFVPGKKARDLRNWLTVYSYWNQGGADNVASMFVYLVNEYLLDTGLQSAPVEETPALGLVHPGRKGFFDSPAEYLVWHKTEYEESSLPANAPVVGLLLYRKHVITKQFYIAQLIHTLESEGLRPVPVFINGVEAHTIVRDWFTSVSEKEAVAFGKIPRNPTQRRDAVSVDAVVSTIGFPLVGGPAGSMESGRQQDVAKSILQSKNVPYIVAAPLLIQDVGSWVRDGIQGLQTVVMYALPELDGAIDTVPLGGLVGDNIFLAEERVKRLASRIRSWVTLRKLAPFDRKVSIVLYGFPPGVGATGTAALLNVPGSLPHVLSTLKSQGYDVGEFQGEADGEAIVQALRRLEDQRAISLGAKGINSLEQDDLKGMGGRYFARDISPSQLKEWLEFPSEWGPSEWGPQPTLPDSKLLLKNLEKQWGKLDSYQGLGTSADGNFVVSGVEFGKVSITVQPALGIEGDPLRLLFQRDLCPHPQYCAFYEWLQNDLQANAVVHFGMHGTVEWLPGSPLGNTGYSWSDVLMGNLPNIYIYAANNPSESIIAKRRGYGTIVSYNVPPYGRAGLYKELATLKDVLIEYREDPAANACLKGTIVANADSAGLLADCPLLDAQGNKVELTPEMADEMPNADFESYASELYQYLQLVENRLFSEGLHSLGARPDHKQMKGYLSAYFEDELPVEAVETIAQTTESLDALRGRLEKLWQHGEQQLAIDTESLLHKCKEAVEIRDLLNRNTEEMDALVRALNGEYICPEAGGDLLRDGPGVLPTGRNIHALDPYRMPSPTAMERGASAAQAILSQHCNAHEGAWPETVAVSLWGLDSIKTRGEALAIVLELIGARPVKEGTGRIVRFELQPLEELVPAGRPRIDVLCNTSGIFRDSFANIIELLDDAFQRAATVEEPLELNYIRKHSFDMVSNGFENPAARIFSNPAGDYGSMVNERVGAGDWEQGEELGDTWQSRYSFSYGRGGERGTARPEVLSALLQTTDRVVQQVDSVEYGLTDIQEYMANTGALKKAAETAKGGKKVDCSIVEAFGKDVKPRELDQVLRLEYRSRLLNPKWAEAMASQGSGGAYEISQRMTALIGWGATTDFKENWVYDQAAERYALDQEMAEKLRKNNPQAFQNVIRRFLEAAGRGMWEADDSTLEKLRALYGELDDELEGI